MMFPFFFLVPSLACVIIPAAIVAALPPSAFAQQEETSLGEEEEEGEDLAGDDIVSDVLDSVDDEEEENDEAAASGDGDINQQTAVPLIDQDQGAANLALNEALDVTVEPRPTLPPEVEPPIENGKIAFTSTRDGNREIYVMNADGSNPIRLTNNLAHDEVPDWGPATDAD